MPRVPTYSGPQIRSAPLEGGFQPNVDAGGPARQLGGALGNVSDAAEKIALRDDSEAAFNAHAQLQSDWMQTDAQLRKQYRGANVEAYKEEASKFWSDAPAKYGDALSPGAKRLISRSLTQTRLQAMASAEGFYTGEKERSADQAASAAKSTEVQFAMTDGGVDALKVARAKIEGINAMTAARKGWTTEQLSTENIKDVSDLHVSLVTNLISRDPAAGRAYFDSNRAEIRGDAQQSLLLQLERSDVLAQSQSHADEIMGRNLPLNEAMQFIEQNFEGEREKVLKTEVMGRYSYAEAARRDGEQKTYGTALLEVEQTGRVSTATWSRLTDTHRAAVLNRQQAEARWRRLEAQGRPVKTDWDLYLDLRQQAMDDPQAFKRLDLKQYIDKIGPSQMEQLADLKGKTEKTGKAPRDAVTLTQQMNATIAALGIKRADAKGKFLSYVQSAVDDATQAKGKPLGFDERQKIIDEAVLQGPDPDAWLWGQKRMFELTPDQRTRFTPNAPTDAPATELQDLNEALKAQGLPQTPANRLALYKRVNP